MGELELGGSPWWTEGQATTYSARLICEVLRALAGAGFHLEAAIDMSAKRADTSTLLFREGLPSSAGASDVLCLSPNETSGLFVVGVGQWRSDEVFQDMSSAFAHLFRNTESSVKQGVSEGSGRAVGCGHG